MEANNNSSNIPAEEVIINESRNVRTSILTSPEIINAAKVKTPKKANDTDGVPMKTDVATYQKRHIMPMAIWLRDISFSECF